MVNLIGIDPQKVVPVSYMMNGLNISVSLYFAIKTARIAYNRRTYLWFILLTMHIALFLSVVETVSDTLIWNNCKGGGFSCFMYGVFYLGVVSVGLLRFVLIVIAHLIEIFLFLRRSPDRSVSSLVNYFRDLILCIVPAAFVTFACSLATLFSDNTMFIPLVLSQSLVEATLMYEASMLLINNTGSSAASGGAGSAVIRSNNGPGQAEAAPQPTSYPLVATYTTSPLKHPKSRGDAYGHYTNNDPNRRSPVPSYWSGRELNEPVESRSAPVNSYLREGTERGMYGGRDYDERETYARMDRLGGQRMPPNTGLWTAGDGGQY
ncbi:hypothetical protein HDV00_004468 [Rhizophlyctis rosea]|nr:hypothetical protein HDV00_004468 [Rhizophlyctis rosea]